MYLNLTLLLLLLSFVFPAQSDSDSVSEIRSLLEFKKGIHADPLEKVGSWNQSTFLDLNTCPQTWYGVVCDDSGYVAAIVLDGLQLSGELKFYTLIGLKNLKNLSLSGNFFTGRLVPALGSMTSLKHLDLSFNGFYGPIPSRINDMYNLNSLNLSSNNFKGGFPNGIRNLNQLKALDLHGNRLWGDIVDVLLELRNVEYVDLSSNSFYGVLPADPKNVSSLANTVRYLNLSHNKLNGEFFSSGGIQLFHNLEVLDLSNNQLSGELPSIGPLPNLRSLRLANNYLYGSVREELLESYIPLVELDLSGNGFTGSVHTINSTTLNFLNLSSNGISGSLPSSLGRCSIVDFSGNKISGDISIMHNWEANLEVLDLHSNKLSGSFPNLTFQFDKLATLNIRNNFLAGTLPSMLGSFPKLSFVDLSSNMFTGSIPRSFFASMTLTNLNLSFNHFSGAIPFQGSHASELLLLPSYPPLAILDLANNSLTGTLSSDIGQMGRLKLLNVSMNNLSSKVPNELCKLSELEYLDLSNNRFDGMIPNKLPPSLKVFNVSYNNLSGSVPENLKKFPLSSFHPGNNLLYFPRGMPSPDSASSQVPDGAKKHRSSKDSTKVAIIVGSVGASMMVAFVLFTYYRSHLQVFRGTSSLDTQDIERDVKLGRSRPSFLKFQANVEAPSTSLSFSHDHLLTSDSRTLSGTEQAEATAEIVEHILPGGTPASSGSKSQNIVDSHSITSGRESFHGSPLSSSPRFIEASEPPVMLDVHSPDRLAGELFFLDTSLTFTAEELSRAPAEVLGRSSHGTVYKATLENGHMLTVKWLRVGLVKHKKEFAKEVKKLGSIRHPNIVSLGAYYWGPREQERLILADYIHGDSLALHLYETTPRRYSPLSFRQRLKVAVDVVRCLLYLHDRGLPHGNLKPTNILLAGPDLTARLSDYGLHRLMTPAGMAEQILNMGALGYCDPELATAVKPTPSLKADVYAFGVILMELLTRRSAGDIISGQSGAVDLTDWVRLCDQEGRGMDCIDRDMAHGEEPSKAMDELLAVSLRCILPVNERPNIRQVFEDICSISA